MSIDQIDRFRKVLHADAGKHGPKNFFLVNSHLRCDVVEQRTACEETALKAVYLKAATVNDQLCTFVDANPDVPFDAFERLLRNDRPHFRVGLHAVLYNQLVAGFFQPAKSAERAMGHGFPSPHWNRLESRCFEGRNGPKPIVARDSNEIECRGVRAICLAASEQVPSRPGAKAQRAHNLQLHPEGALSRLPMEGAAHREGSARPPRDPLHAHLSSLPALGSGRML